MLVFNNSVPRLQMQSKIVQHINNNCLSEYRVFSLKCDCPIKMSFTIDNTQL